MNDMGIDRQTAGIMLGGLLVIGWAVAFGLALLGDQLARWWRGRS